MLLFLVSVDEKYWAKKFAYPRFIKEMNETQYHEICKLAEYEDNILFKENPISKLQDMPSKYKFEFNNENICHNINFI